MTTATKKRASKPRAPAGLVMGQALLHPEPLQGRKATVLLPLHTKSEGNEREHHRVVQKRTDEQRNCTAFWLGRLGAARWREDIVRVKFVRLGPGQLDQGDNLCSSSKHIRDQVAAWIAGYGTARVLDVAKGKLVPTRGDDGPNCGVHWDQDHQEKLTHFGVRVEIYVAAAGGGEIRVAGQSQAAASGT